MMKFEIKQLDKLNIYQSVTASRVILGDKITEYRHFRLFELSLLEKTDTEMIFKYLLTDQQMEDTALIHKWIADLEWVQSELVIRTDVNGNFLSIENLDKIKRIWNDKFKTLLQNKYRQKGANEMINQTTLLLNDKQRFEDQFLGYSFLRTFFNGYYEKNEITETELNLKGYFGEVDLNAIIKSDIEESEYLKIQNSIILNDQKFDKKAFTKLIRNITHTIDAKADLDIDLEEIFVYDKTGWIQEANMYLEASVQDFYAIINAHQVTKLSEEEKNSIISEWAIQRKPNRPSLLVD